MCVPRCSRWCWCNKRDGVNERQIFFVVAPVARARRGKGQRRRERIDDVQRLQQPLRVAELFQQVFAFLVRDQARQRAALALHAMNAPGLLGALVHRQRQAAVLQLLVQVNGRGRQKNHHRAFNVIFLRHHLARLRVFAGAGDGQLAFALQQLQARSWRAPLRLPRPRRGFCV